MPAAPAPAEPEEPAEADVLARAARALDGLAFAYMKRRAVEVSAAVDYQEITPNLYGTWRGEILAVSADGRTLVCLRDERCWDVEGEMEFLHIPDQYDSLALTMVAVMPGRQRVDFAFFEDSESTATASPPRRVSAFEPHDAPDWAEPFIEWLDGDLADVRVSSSSNPVSHVFLSEGERGMPCIEEGGAFRCGRPSLTGVGYENLSYSPEPVQFGPGIIAVRRGGIFDTDDAYHNVASVLLFDARVPEIRWIATIPKQGHTRSRPDANSDDVLDVLLDWEIDAPRRANASDPICFTMRRSESARALRFSLDPNRHDGTSDSPAQIPRFARASALPLRATPPELATGSDFTGTWSLMADGSVERSRRCPRSR